MKEPWFWRDDSLSARMVRRVLWPAKKLYAFGQGMRWRFANPYRSETPVICIGNASLGGVGKTPFAMALCALFQKTKNAPAVHFVSRGYGGALRGPVRVVPEEHTYHDVGDEALLLARIAPTWVAKSRRDGIKAAESAGADIIIMDDGFQNPTIAKALSILLVNKESVQPTLHTFPAGPLREPLAEAAKRAELIVAVGDCDVNNVRVDGHCAMEIETFDTSSPLYAFAGIGAPDRFFSSLTSAGGDVINIASFPDHHPYSESEIIGLKKDAMRRNAQIVTTRKDFVRIPEECQDGIVMIDATMVIDDTDTFIEKIRDRSKDVAAVLG